MNISFNKVKAAGVQDFVNMMIGAFESGFTKNNNPTLAEIYQVARNHCKDVHEIKLPTIVEQWGENTAKECGLKLTTQINGQLQKTEDYHEDFGDCLFISFSRDDKGNILGEPPEVCFSSVHTDGFDESEWTHFIHQDWNFLFTEADPKNFPARN